MTASVFADSTRMFDAFQAGQLDIADWPVPQDSWNSYAAKPDFLETLPQPALELLQIDFNHNNNFLGVPFQENRGTDSFNSPSTKQPTQAGIEIRRGIAHLLDKLGFTSGGSSTSLPQFVDIEAARAQSLTPTGSLAASTLPPAVLAEDCPPHPWFGPCDASHPPASAYNLVTDLLADPVDASVTHGYPGEADMRAACDHFLLAGFTTTSPNPQPQACLDVALARARIIAPTGAKVNFYARADSPYKEFSTIIGDALDFLFKPSYIPSSDDSRIKYTDSNGNNVFDPGEMVVYDSNGLYFPLFGQNTTKVRYFDVNNNGVFDASEPVVYDSDLNGLLDQDQGVDCIPHEPGPFRGDPLIDDARLKYVDSNGNNLRDPSEWIILDNNLDGVFGLNGDTFITGCGEEGGIPAGSPLKDDPRLKWWDANGNNVVDGPDDLVYDFDGDNVFEQEFVIDGIGSPLMPLKVDPRIKSMEENGIPWWNLYDDVLYDKNDNNEYDVGDALVSQWTLPPDATYNSGEPLISAGPLKSDSRIKFMDLKHLDPDPDIVAVVPPNTRWDPGQEHVVYDANNDGKYTSPPDYVIRLYPSVESLTYEASTYSLYSSSSMKYLDSNGNTLYDQGESVVYDSNGDGQFNQGELPILVARLKDDPQIRYVDNDSGQRSIVYDVNLDGLFEQGETVIAGPAPTFPGGEPIVLWGTSQQKQFYSLYDIADIVLSTTPRNDWNLYSGNSLVPYTPDQLYRLYHSQFASDACGGVTSANVQNYVFYCNPKFDQYVSMAVSTLSINSMYTAFSNAAMTAHRDVMTIPVMSPVHRYVALNGWGAQPSLVPEVGQGYHAGYGFWSLMNMQQRTGYTPSDPRYRPGAGDQHLIRRGFSGPINSLSPFYSRTPWEVEVLSLVYDSMMKMNPNTGPGGIFDWMAIRHTESYDADGGTTLTWTLRQDLQFHDGVYITAADVVYSILAYKSLPPPRFQISLAKVLSVVSDGQQVVKVKLAGQSYFYLWEIGTMPILPKHIWAATCGDPFSPTSICGSPSFDVMTTGKMIGSGPFKCKNLNTGAAGENCTRTSARTLGTMQVSDGGQIVLSAYDRYMRGPVVRGSNLHKFSWADKNNNGVVELTEFAEAALYYGKPHPYWNNPLFGLDPTKVDIGEMATLATYYGYTLTAPFPPDPSLMIGMDPVIDPFCSPTAC